GAGVEQSFQDVVVDRRGIALHQGHETPSENVVTLRVQQPRLVGNEVCDPCRGFARMVQEPCEEPNDLEDVAVLTSHCVAHENPQRLLDVEIPDLVAVRVPEPELLVKAEEAGSEI